MLTMLERGRQSSGHSVLNALSDGAHRAAEVIDAVLTAPFHWAEGRRTMAMLAAMDEHALEDIGLTHGDVRDALAVPVLSDATVFLASRRAERRAAH